MTGTPSPDRRFIEESFPVKEVGAASSREKSIRHGHISTLHIWWARRPLAASRATAYAALVPAPKDIEEWERQRKFIIELCQWENSNNPVLLERARKAILEAHAARLSEETGKTVTVEDIQAGRAPRPRVLDPFAGGGSYPLEALRLGCEAYANDYNPVAVLIEKATLEYPQKFGRPFENMPEWALPKAGRLKERSGKKEQQLSLLDEARDETDTKDFNPLLNAVHYWGEWVLNEARKELSEFYPPDPDGSIPVGYIWARTIPCQNPACGEDIPLMRQFWLAKKDKKKVSLYPQVSKGKLQFHIVGDGYEKWPERFDPEKGTITHAVVTCPICGTVIDAKDNRRLFQEGKSSQKMMAVVTKFPNKSGKNYRLPTEIDLNTYSTADTHLQTKQQQIMEKHGVDPVPDELITESMPGGFHTPAYGMKNWGSLFNCRQKLAMITFLDKVREAHNHMVQDNGEIEFSKAVATYLGLCLSRMADFTSNLSRWKPDAEALVQALTRQALCMVWDYTENHPTIDTAGSWSSMQERMLSVVQNLVIPNPASVEQGSATQLRYPDNYFDAILTDPPYYYSITYADLSDFFYVWLNRSIGYLYPELFSTPLTPKSGEIIEKKFWDKTSIQDADWYESKMRNALQEIFRVLKKGAPAIVVYAHKTTLGWETLINALLDSGLVVTGSWPINTEQEARLMARESAALASSIYIVTRKMPRQPTGFYNEVRTELRQHLDSKLHRLWEEGIGGADFFIAAIGSAIEVFGKYEQVMDYEGNIVRANRLLEEVRTIATDYAVRQILHNGFAAEISGLTRLYVLWRWNYGEALVPFDEARKLSQSCGIDISEAWSKTGVIRKEKEFVRLLGPQGRKLDDLDNPRDLIDVLHKSLLLWEKGQRAEMVKALAEKGHGKSEAFYRVAQAISETLPLESKEKKLLDGFLAGRERVQEEVEKQGVQGKLWE